jgi:hypothetical protein
MGTPTYVCDSSGRLRGLRRILKTNNVRTNTEPDVSVDKKRGWDPNFTLVYGTTSFSCFIFRRIKNVRDEGKHFMVKL